MPEATDVPSSTSPTKRLYLCAILFFTFSLIIFPVKNVSAVTLLDMATAHINQKSALFNSIEYRYNSFESLPSWASALKRSQPEFKQFMACVHQIQHCQTREQRNWRKFVMSVKDKTRPHILLAVNLYFNKWPYKSDRDLYNREEYWATLGEFLTNAGDCEDFAIAKYYTLKALGFKEHEIRIVAVTTSPRKKGHVVLAVYEDTDVLILDNLSNAPFSHRERSNYTPLYSINQSTHWVHRQDPVKG